MRRLWLAAALLGLVSATATAGTSSDPDIADASNDVGIGRGDITGIWFESVSKGVKITARLRDVDSDDRSLLVFTSFSLGGTSESPTLGLRWNGDTLGQTDFAGDTKPNDMLDVSFRPGRPATFSGTLAWGAYAGLQPGAQLTNLRALTSFYDESYQDGSGNKWRVQYDEANGRSVTLQNAGAARAVAPAGSPTPLGDLGGHPWLAPLVIVGATTGGAWAGFTLWRRRSAS